MMARRVAAAPAWLRTSWRQLANPRAIGWTQGRHLLLSLSIVALLVGVVPLGSSGYAVYADWGGEWLEEVHEFFANTLLLLVGVHLSVLALSSLVQRRNLARPMFDGRSPPNDTGSPTTVAAPSSVVRRISSAFVCSCSTT